MAISNTPFTSAMLDDMMRLVDFHQPPKMLLMPGNMAAEFSKFPTRPNEVIAPNRLTFGAGTSTYLGYDVRVADVPPRVDYDWSGCRSPSRAKRRHAIGHPQRVKITTTPVGYLISKDMINGMERRMMSTLMGDP